MQVRHLRVITFAATGPEASVDAALRDVAIPALLREPVVCEAWIGRTGRPEVRRRVLASTWTDAPADPESAPDFIALRTPGVAGSESVVDRLEQVDVQVHARFDRTDAARILRVFRGRAKPGELDAYVVAARAGMTADAERFDGLVTFVLGPKSADEFLTVSTWTSWTAVEEATGGSVQQPFATRNADRLVDFTVEHHEILPGAPIRGDRREI